jgi:hypothetical protein
MRGMCMLRIYEVEFGNNKCLIDERIKRNKTYAISVRFMFEPLIRNLCEIDLGYYFKLEDEIDDYVIGVFIVLKDNRIFLICRKANPYA